MRVTPFSFLEQKDITPSGPPVPWTPAFITTEWWNDVSDSSTVTLSGTTIVSVADKSGNGYDLIQTEDTAVRPSLVTGASGINNLDTMRMDAECMYVDWSGTAADHKSINMFFVCQPDDTTPTSNNAIIRRGFSASSLGGTLRFTSGGLGGFWRIGTSNQGLTTKATGILSPSVNEFLIDYDSGANTTDLIAYQDANAFSTTTGISSYLAGTGDDVRPVIGGAYTADNWGAASPPIFSDTFTGLYGEIVCVVDTNITTDTQQKIEGYLAWKWGTEGNLPTGHPYKNAAPTT